MAALGYPAAGVDKLVGVIDVGSNSVRLVVFEDEARSPDYFFNEKTICRLGEGLDESGRLNPAGRVRALATLGRYMALAEAMNVTEVIGVGTAALREAEDGQDFRDEVLRETGLDIRVATGGEEARLSAEGVLLGWPDARGVVADMGGSSLEMAEIADGEVRAAVSTHAGHIRICESWSGNREKAMAELRLAAGRFPRGGDLVLVGGAWRALAKAQMSRMKYPLHVLMGYDIPPGEALELCDWAREADTSELKSASGAGAGRLASIAAGAEALKVLIGLLEPRAIIVSAFGLREGLIHERMSAELRAQEPLLAAARGMELRAARSPGFGDELFNWLAPAFSGLTADKLRLTRAACLLHDVNWRAHPDFRAAACFATVTRSNLSGVGHKSRMFIGAALVHRYKSPDYTRDIEQAIGLIAEDDRREAEAVGRAMRLGAMLTGSVSGLLNRSRLTRTDDELVLTLEPGVASLAGERVERRLAALANVLGLAPRLVA